MAPALATFAASTASMVIPEAIGLNIQLISRLRFFEAKVFCAMCLTKFLVTVAAVVGAAAGPTENTGANID